MSDPTDEPAIETPQVLIIGAGINGAGLFRDLCCQNMPCMIIDKTDYGAGTSAAPSRLIHGGLKYIETAELGLVAQSTLERNLLLRNAPHMVAPLETMIPVFSWMKGVTAALRTLFGATSTARSRGAILIKIGLSLYDFYGSRHRVMPRHRMIGRRRALAEFPGMTPTIVAAGFYHDASIARPERLVYELVADGLAAEPRASAYNHARVTGRDGGVLTITHDDGRVRKVRPAVVVNAAGPWIDAANAAIGEPTRLIGGTKGSHVLLDHPQLLAVLKGRMIYFEADDGRICLVYDYLGKALVGSTDIKAANPDSVRCEEDEIDYFLASLHALLPGLAFDRRQVTYAYAGIRPLPASDAANPGLISRDHSAPVIEPTPERPFPVLSLVGGKWTTFRGFAEEVTDTLLARLDRKRMVSTEALAIGGGKRFPATPAERESYVRQLARQHGLTAGRIETLLGRYGTTVEALLSAPSAEDDGMRLAGAEDYSRREIDYIARHEQVGTLEDLVFRRTTLAIEGRLSRANLPQIAAVAGAALGWDAERQADEIERVVVRLADFHGVSL